MRWTPAALVTALLAAMPGSIPGQAVPIAAVDRAERAAAPYVGLDPRDDIGLGEVTVEPEPSTRPVGKVIWTTSSPAEVESASEVVDRLSASGIPEVALRAYLRAQATTAESDAACGIPWYLLAAIGRVESNHGRYGGAKLREDGYGTRPIRGIPLDGRPGVALIRDTDDGRLDGDTVYDRAVGPMQFIPSSWRRVAADGNGDGRRDPNNIFDATVGSATYLCAGNGNLRDRAQQAQAVFRYNHSQEYVRVVMALAEDYAGGQVSPLPHEEPAGTPPPVLPEPPAPPANHGPPPGLEPEPPAPPPPPPPPPVRPPAREPLDPRPGGTITCPTTTTSSTSSTSSTTTTTTSTTTVPAGWPCPTTTTTSSTTTTTAAAVSASTSTSATTTSTAVPGSTTSSSTSSP